MILLSGSNSGPEETMMIRLKSRFAFYLAAAIHIAQPTLAGSGLAGSEWRPLSSLDTDPEDGIDMFLRFESDGKLAGHSGCNRFFGTYEISGDIVEFGPIGATRMACPGLIMDQETRLFSVLDRVRSYKRDRINLELLDGNGEALIRLVQTDAD